jgi:hypothetical protein
MNNIITNNMNNIITNNMNKMYNNKKLDENGISIYIHNEHSAQDCKNMMLTDINQQVIFKIIQYPDDKIRIKQIQILDNNIDKDDIHVYEINEYVIIQFFEDLDDDILNYCSIEIIFNKIYIYRDDYNNILEIAIYTN